MPEGQSNANLIGKVGMLTIAVRGPGKPGEVELAVRGGTERFFAVAAEPLPAGTTVLVIDTGGGRTVTVVAWDDPFARVTSY